MYEELVYALKKCGYPGDVHCCRDCVFANDGGTCHRKKLLPSAADAIEELQKDLERSKDFEAFWQHEAEEALRKYQVAISRKPQWIPVTERLPDEYVSVLCYCSRNGQYGCGEWCKEDNGTIYWIGLNGMIPTHWMPLPSAPTEE